MRPSSLLLVAASLLASGAAASAAPGEGWQGKFLGQPVILTPAAEAVRSEVVLISDANGWSADDAALAERLKDAGSIVLGLDYPSIVEAINASSDSCAYLVSDIESLSQTVQRGIGNASLQQPAVTGFGAGATLALGIVAQTPGATIARTVAIDPGDRLPFDKPLCTPAAKELTPSGTIYALTAGALPNPVKVIFTPAATDLGRAHAERLDDSWEAIEIENTDEAPFDAAFTELRSAGDGEAQLADLPLAVLDAEPSRDAMAVVYSGDGGWRDLDKIVAEHLQQAGVPVVGVDSLRYFWSEKTPQQTAADLQAIIDAYSKRWNVSKVYLVGYSFGADILPSTYLAMDDGHRAKVERLSLLALAASGDYRISVAGWLGISSGKGPSTLADLARIPASIVQCFYGSDDADSVCGSLRDKGVQVIETSGGHHFDGDYQALADRILG